jgi:hypothetical protein
MFQLTTDQYHYWTSDENGCASPRNSMIRCNGAAVAAPCICSLPFGQGTSVFAIGKQIEFMRHLQADPDAAVAKLATNLAAMLPLGCPRECRVQLCLHVDEQLPLLQRGVVNDNIVLVVTGFDPDKCEAARQQMTGQTIAQIFESRALHACAEASRAYRMCIAQNVFRMLEEEYPVSIPEPVRTKNTMDFPQLHLIRDPVTDWFLIGADMNVGTEACVFQSPLVGYTIFTQNVPNPTRWIVPSSNGCSINVGEQAPEFPAVEKLLTSDEFRAFLRLLQKDQTIPDCVAIQPQPEHTNQSVNFGAYGSAYNNRDINTPTTHAETIVVQLRALATGISTATRQNGISSILKCLTIHEMAEFTTSTHVTVPNSAEWQVHLTNIDEARRPYYLMNQTTSRCNKDGMVVAFEINKDKLSPVSPQLIM